MTRPMKGNAAEKGPPQGGGTSEGPWTAPYATTRNISQKKTLMIRRVIRGGEG